MKWHQIVLRSAAFAIALGVAVPTWSQAKPEEKDQPLKMSQVPAKVQEAIKKYASPAEIKQISKGDVDGTVAYEFQIEKAGRQSEVAITPDGKFLTSEETIPLSEVPEAARRTVNAQAAGGKVISTEKVVEHGATSFEAVIEKDGKQSEIAVSPDGRVVGSQTDVALADVPAAARATITAKAAGGKVVSMKKSLEDGQTTFVAVIEKAGKQQQISVAPDGKIVETENIKH
jgi:hypothetical protein